VLQRDDLPFIDSSDTTGKAGITLEATFDADYGRLPERVYNTAEGLAQPDRLDPAVVGKKGYVPDGIRAR